ncbi:MAG TPA: CheR family methyltransferase [Gammaproteobacteria bacterium]
MRAPHRNSPARPSPGGNGQDAALPRPAREFRFDDRDFERVRRLIYAHAGISLGESKRDMVYGRVTRRLRALKLRSFAEYLARLESDAAEFEEFVNSLTTNLTAFFREDHHFPILAELLRRHAADGPVSLWSAACSTGEEAYSMAITAIETLGPNPRVRILGTDLDTRAVRTADLGIYPLERVEKVGAERLKRFFLKGTGEKTGYARVRPEVRALVRFRPMNLMTPAWPIRGPFHAIFCRNAMIYFDRAAQRRVLERFRPLLHPDGRLFAGHAEGLSHCGDLFEPEGRTVYRPVGETSMR